MTLMLPKGEDSWGPAFALGAPSPLPTLLRNWLQPGGQPPVGCGSGGCCSLVLLLRLQM